MARRAPPNTKQALLEAAEVCFAAHGLDATKVEDITAQIGIAKGAFYSYFDSKEECWRSIVEGFLGRMRDAVDVHEAAVSSTRAPLPERLEIWLAHDLQVFEFCWSNRALLHMMMSGSGGVAYAHLLDEFARRCAKNAETLVAELVREGVYRDDTDPNLVACMLGGAYDRLVREIIREPKRPDLARIVRKAQSLFMHGLLTDEAKTQLRDLTQAAQVTYATQVTRVARATREPKPRAAREAKTGKLRSA